jgi:tetratricopeptide (TPR) repeat protein
MMRRPYLPMAPASFITGLALVFILAPGLAAGSPVLSGSFRADTYGTLELATEGERVTGTAVDGGPCKFDAQRQVLEGDFQDGVLVGKLTVCHTSNSSCPAEVAYPILAFYNEAEQSLVAHVRLPSGCESVALKGGRFVLVPVRKEPVEPAPPPGSNPGTSSASQVANKRTPRDLESAKRANEQGRQLYLENNFVQAAKQFEISLSHDSGDRNWAAYMGRGSSRLKLGQVDGAIEDLERARSANARVSPAAKDTRILYMLGCAYGQKGDKKKALEYLSLVVKVGYPLHEVVENDPDLKRHLGNEQEFNNLLKKSREKKQQAQSRGTPSGTP